LKLRATSYAWVQGARCNQLRNLGEARTTDDGRRATGEPLPASERPSERGCIDALGSSGPCANGRRRHETSMGRSVSAGEWKLCGPGRADLRRFEAARELLAAYTFSPSARSKQARGFDAVTQICEGARAEPGLGPTTPRGRRRESSSGWMNHDRGSEPAISPPRLAVGGGADDQGSDCATLTGARPDRSAAACRCPQARQRRRRGGQSAVANVMAPAITHVDPG